MSRYNVTYKPGGVIPKDIGLTVKMQRLPEMAKPVDCPECPPGECTSPPLTGAWSKYVTASSPDAYEKLPGYSTDLHVVGDSDVDFINGGITLSKSLVGLLLNADWATAGEASPLWINQAAITWSVSTTSTPGTGGQWFEFHFATVNGVLLVYGSGAGFDGGYQDEVLATITATPSYNGVALPALSLRMLSSAM